MLVVAGLSLQNMKPRVWDPASPHHLPQLKAVMVSYADFHRMPARRKLATEQGLHRALGIPVEVKVYLDNGSFWFLSSGGGLSTRRARKLRQQYEKFVAEARPDWHPIPYDIIPTPKMTHKEQRQCYQRTVQAGWAYRHDGYVPVVHVSRFLDEYLVSVQAHEGAASKRSLAIGGLVPNLLRASRAVPYADVLRGLKQVREVFKDKEIHVFGVGGTATLHLAALLGMDSVDSSGWRNRAARGLIQLQGSGERMVAELGSWRGRRPSEEEWARLRECRCPACRMDGMEGLKAGRIEGFCHRATHNLWTLLEEARLIDEHLAKGTYDQWYGSHLDNSIYKPLVDAALEMLRARTPSA